jgi:nucleotide-binding universal stress UspA family protein
MPNRTPKQRVSHPVPNTAEGFRSLLVPIDLSPLSARVVGRVALLPLAQDARITLLHVVPMSLSRGARRRAEGDARKVLVVESRRLARTMPASVRIRRLMRTGAAAAEIAKAARAVSAELIVMGRGGGRAIRDIFLGSTAERVIRQGRLPVLAVRLGPRGPYRRPMLAVDVDGAAHGTLVMLLRVIPPPRPRVTVVHAYHGPYQGLMYPSLSESGARGYDAPYRQEALRNVRKVLSVALAQARVRPEEAPSWKVHVRYGAPRAIVESAVRKANTDLVALGTRGYRGVVDAFLGTVAGDVLREVSCDVLVVPPRRNVARAMR